MKRYWNLKTVAQWELDENPFTGTLEQAIDLALATKAKSVILEYPAGHLISLDEYEDYDGALEIIEAELADRQAGFEYDAYKARRKDGE